MSHYLLIDSNYLAHRSFHVMGGLSYRGGPTGVIYGVLRDIQALRDRFATDNLVFCWDHGRSRRELDYRFYKETRRSRTYTVEQMTALTGLHTQIKQLKETVLPDLGFKNNFYSEGFEGDDIIASICAGFDNGTSATIVSGDSDLYQLLTSRVNYFNPRGSETITRSTFKHRYGIPPTLWARVKAIAGCDSDDISGVQGVGEKTAIKYLKGELDEKCEAFKKIEKAKTFIARNLKLTLLPYEGCPDYDLREQPPISAKTWKSVTMRFGMVSLNKTQRKREGFF